MDGRPVRRRPPALAGRGDRQDRLQRRGVEAAASRLHLVAVGARPFAQRHDRDQQVAAEVGQLVVDPGRDGREDRSGDEAVAELFNDSGSDRMTASAKALSYLSTGGDPKLLIDHARRLVFVKGNDSHDYKFSSAVLEDYFHVSPAWRDRFLATSVFNLKGNRDNDNPLIQRTRSALA